MPKKFEKDINLEERAALVALKLPKDKDWEIEDSLEELSLLTKSAGAAVVTKFIQEREKPDPAYFLGKGKIGELSNLCNEEDINLVIFDHNITPAQQRNLEDKLNNKVLDRTALILDIFAQRAHTKEGKLQVELAQMTYLLPRLMGKGIMLSRLGGGIGTRGPGETKLEVDRRRIRDKITFIKKELKKVRKHRALHRKSRQSIPLPVIALIGYTNAGKSTLLNTLTKASAFVEDKLFATLDPMVRKLTLPNKQRVLISDTVGFIKKLPHQLIAAFKATFEEVAEADILLHVIDADHPRMEEQIKAVNNVLEEIDIGEKHIIYALNKIDKIKNENVRKRLLWQHENSVLISALSGEGINDLCYKIEDLLRHLVSHIKLTIPYSEAKTLALIHQRGKILKEKYLKHKIVIEAEVEYQLAESLRKRIL